MHAFTVLFIYLWKAVGSFIFQLNTFITINKNNLFDMLTQWREPKTIKLITLDDACKELLSLT